MKRYTLSFSLVGALLSLGGCAFTDINMQMPVEVEGASSQMGRGRPIVVVVPFEEARGEHVARCGMQKNGYNMDTADATCNVEPVQWIGNLLAQELEQAGFEVSVMNEAAVGDIPVVEGSLVKLFVEPVIGMWSSSLEADLHVLLRVRRRDGLDAERHFFQKGIRSGAMLSITPLFETALGRATNEIMREMVVSVADLLDDYPTRGFRR